jgi:TonB family protein
MVRLFLGTFLLVCCTLLAASQETSAPVEVPAESLQKLLIRRVAPAYPPLARQARIQGTVVLKVIVNKAGEVREAEPISGHPMLCPSAIAAVKQWRYTPYVEDGEPVEVTTTIQINFQFAGQPSSSSGDEAHPNGSGPSSQPRESAGGVDTERLRVAVPGERVRVSSGVSSGLIVSKVPPRYPEDAREQRIQGMVVLMVDIDKEGNVYKTELISGHPLLAPAAIEAVQQWKYKPYLLNGAPVEVETQVQVNFVLKPQQPST